MTAAIRTESLTKHFGEVVALEGLDLEVRTGEVMGFLGPNGAGKTTTTRLLLDLLRPTRGRAEVLGRDTRVDALEVRARTGYLPGDLALPERWTTHELLAFHGRLRGGLDRGHADQLADRLGLDPTRPLGDLSRGNRQKVGIVQAFVSRPELLILDEPSSGLDPLVQRELLDLVREVREDGRTVFFSSHVLSEVERVADRVAIIREGRLLLVDDVANLKGRSLVRMRIRFDQAPPLDEFAHLDAVREASTEDATLHLVVEGSPDQVIKTAARYRVEGFSSDEADLEEIFLTYYAIGRAGEERDDG